MVNNNPHMKINSSVPPSDWVETTLGEVCEIIMGQSPKGETYNLDGDGLPFYQGVTEFDEKYVKIKTYTSEPTKIIEPNTILFSVRAPVGRVNFTEHKSCIGRGNAGLKMNNGNQEFLFYLLRFLEKQIQNRTSGTVFTSISGKELKEIPIIIPSNLQEQKAIASVLSAFDDKIELLREQNKTLEEMGQTIFKEWFLPSSQAGGKYGVDDLSADKAGELPEGWRVGKLGEIGQVICGKTPSKENKEYFGGDIPFIKIPDMHGEVFIIRTEDSLTEFGANTQKNKFIPKNSICVSCIATVGLVSITSRDSQTNQQINSIVPSDKKYLEYLYFVLTNMKNDLLAIGSGGSATLNINTSTFSNIKIVIPNKEILNDFHNTTNSIFTKILDNLYQIQSLARSRDELLPKLMSGVVRVNF